MFGGKKPRGFTIVETLIFLAVTGILFLSVVALLEGKQSNTYYFQGIHEFYSQMQDISNNVETGYYDDSAGYVCNYNAFSNTFTISTMAGSTAQGTNYGCSFVGEIIQFAPEVSSGGNPQYQEYEVYPVFGKQWGDVQQDPVNGFQGAYRAYPVVPSGSGQIVQLPADLQIQKVCYSYGSGTGSEACSANQHSVIGFFSNFIQSTSATTSSSVTSVLVPIPGDGSPNGFEYNADVPGFISSLTNNFSTYATASEAGFPSVPPTIINPSGGVQICVGSTSLANTYGIITIGGHGNGNSGGNPLNVELNAGATQCPS